MLQLSSGTPGPGCGDVISKYDVMIEYIIMKYKTK